MNLVNHPDIIWPDGWVSSNAGAEILRLGEDAVVTTVALSDDRLSVDVESNGRRYNAFLGVKNNNTALLRLCLQIFQENIGERLIDIGEEMEI